MASYADPADLFAFGLPRDAASNPGRPAEADAVADAIELDVHCFALGDAVSFRAENGGSLPAPLVEGVSYAAIPLDEARFQVAAAAGGPALNLTTAGAYFLVIAPLPVAACLEWAARIIDDMLPGHLVPVASPVPEILRMTCAELAAGKLLALRGVSSASIASMVDDAHKRIERWARGVPIRGSGAQEPAQLAVVASVPYRDRRGWSRFGGL